ncbi:hypothetical protein [uncultured Thiodictyon sp.]|uniref:hypothetical protein n=1 Tax=uncultured Thiodictyon sp. TaxID=1846217 RepID=UPI0025F2C52E|nr:hypothetical protein [uncultured Thiodictyon sp.]
MVFIDTYEALWSDRPDKAGAAALETDAWVRELVAAAPGVLFVFFGRERLGWDRRFPRDWGGLLADQHLAQLLQATDRLPEAEPPLRRALLILLAFTRTTGHAHPHLRLFLANYRSPLAAWSPDPAESARRLADLGASPACRRMSGTACSRVEAVGSAARTRTAAVSQAS